MMNLDEVLRGIGQQMSRSIPQWDSGALQPQTQAPSAPNLGPWGQAASSMFPDWPGGFGGGFPEMGGGAGMFNEGGGPGVFGFPERQADALGHVTAAKNQFGSTGVGATPDTSSHQSFVSSMYPVAKAWQDKTGIPAEYFLAANASESNWGNAPGNELFGIKNTSGHASTGPLGTWEQGQGSTNAAFNAYDSPDSAYSDFVNLISNGRYSNAWGQFQRDRDPDALFRNLNSAGYATDPSWGNKISQIAGGIRTMLPKEGTNQTLGINDANPQAPPADGHGGRTTQFDPQLNASEQLAACGPTAAAAMASAFGKGVTTRQAVDAARTGGLWSTGTGMFGPQSEVSLLGKLGVQAHTEGVDWNRVNQIASPNSPVIVDTPGHYFYIDGSDGRGSYHVGTSGTDLKHGSEWMTPAQMAQVMGAPRTLIVGG